MDRKRIFVALALAAAFGVCLAEPATAQPPAGGGGRRGGRGDGGRFFRPAQERWRQMSPEDRQRFRSNAERWLSLPPEEQRALRDREIARRERIRREADAALNQSGLKLEAEKRELFERRYLQERRKIERGLRQELREKRQRELAPVMEDLKKEFSEQSKNVSPATTVAPATPASASPGK